MVRIIIVHLSPVFIAGVVALLAGQSVVTIAGELTGVENLLLFLKRVNADLVIISARLSGIGEAITGMVDHFPDTKIMLQVPDYGDEHLVKMIDAGAHSVIRQNADGDEMLQGISAVHHGDEHLPAETQARILELSKSKKLTHQESAILNLVEKGLGNKQIADALGLKESTVKTYRKSLNYKLGAHSGPEAVFNARKRGLL